MKSKELQNKTKSELTATLSELKIKLAKLSFELEANILKDTSQIGETKKDIARILTIMKKSNH